jgi:hypothetical protein
MSQPARSAALAIAIALLAAGCGGGSSTVGFKKAGPPAPQECIDRFNADESARAAGRHFYSPGHDSRAGHAFFAIDPERGRTDICVVVFAARESDREYGTIGAFGGPPMPPSDADFGSGEGAWRYTTEFSFTSEKERLAVQKQGAEQANVALHRDGTIAALP